MLSGHVLGDYSKIIRAIESIKKKARFDDELYATYELVASTFGFYGYDAFTIRQGARVWGITDTDHLLFKDWLNGFKHIWLVLNKTSKADQWLFGKLDRHYKPIVKEKFRFEDKFINIIIDKPFKLAKDLYARGVPTAWVCGRKKDAHRLKQKLIEEGICAEVAEEERKEQIEDKLLNGTQIILYLNSRVSKGIDLPLISVVFVYNYAFAVPDDNAVRAMRDELEQVILRCSPIDENDPSRRYIIWCQRIGKKRSSGRSKQEQDFIGSWLNERAEEGMIPKNYKVEKLFKSNWLPLVNISDLPIYIYHIAH